MTEIPGNLPEVLALPRRGEVNARRLWRLPTVNRQDRDGPPNFVEFNGKFLGFSSSHREVHGVHTGGDTYARARIDRCAACRWFEPRIFRVDDVAEDYSGAENARYLVHFGGFSIVPGEQIRVRHEWLTSAFEVVEALTTRRSNRFEGEVDEDDPRPPSMSSYLTPPAARALAMAAANDDDLQHAYVNRAVS